MREFRPTRFDILPTIIKNLIIINALVFLAQNTFAGPTSSFSVEDYFALHAWQSKLFQPWQRERLVGGTALAGKAVIDRRTVGIQVEDEAIELRSESGLKGVLPKNTNVKVSSYNRMVLLTGQVNSENERALTERFVKSQDNVKMLVNDLAVMPESSLTQRAQDKLITSRVRAILIQAKDIHASAVAIVTERGIVYLMGRLTEAEAKRVADLVSGSQISGVQKVVKVFDYISEEDLKRLVAPSVR
jgi:osmotically-inducible protein OsmY